MLFEHTEHVVSEDSAEDDGALSSIANSSTLLLLRPGGFRSSSSSSSTIDVFVNILVNIYTYICTKYTTYVNYTKIYKL